MQNFQIMSDVSFYKHKKWSQKGKNGKKIFCYSEFKFMRPAPKRESSNLGCIKERIFKFDLWEKKSGHPWSIRFTEFSFIFKIIYSSSPIIKIMTATSSTLERMKRIPDMKKKREVFINQKLIRIVNQKVLHINHPQ